jgi:hypothetical protein
MAARDCHVTFVFKDPSDRVVHRRAPYRNTFEYVSTVIAATASQEFRAAA